MNALIFILWRCCFVTFLKHFSEFFDRYRKGTNFTLDNHCKIMSNFSNLLDTAYTKTQIRIKGFLWFIYFSYPGPKHYDKISTDALKRFPSFVSENCSHSDAHGLWYSRAESYFKNQRFRHKHDIPKIIEKKGKYKGKRKLTRTRKMKLLLKRHALVWNIFCRFFQKVNMLSIGPDIKVNWKIRVVCQMISAIMSL